MIHLDAEELYISAVASVTSCIIVTCSVFCRNKKIPLWSLFLNCLFTFTMDAVLTQIMICLAEAVLRNSRFFA